MRTPVFLYIVAALWFLLSAHGSALGTDRSGTTQPSAARSATMPLAPLTLPADKQLKVMPITQAGSVEEALRFSKDEKIILEDVNDGDSQLDTSALNVLLRRAEMLPEGTGTFEEAERPNPKDFWREPQRYRGRFVQVEGLYAGRTTPWTENVTPSRWWGKRDVWMVELYEPKTEKIIIVFLTRKPPPGLARGRPLRFAGIFYKVVTLPEDPETGDSSKTHEHPVIVVKTLFHRQSAVRFPSWALAAIVVVVAMMLTAFMMLRRKVARQRAAARREYTPLRLDEAAGEDVPDGQKVDDELVRQIESYRLERRSEDADDT